LFQAPFVSSILRIVDRRRRLPDCHRHLARSEPLRRAELLEADDRRALGREGPELRRGELGVQIEVALLVGVPDVQLWSIARRIVRVRTVGVVGQRARGGEQGEEESPAA
jgi:hypothetical protein